ncbi:MAG: hypothetical protein Q8K02_06820 [Flavobacterium sp.]|nr:hypothetical protein [Flavobacterium sp.]
MKNFSMIVVLILVGCASKEAFQTQFPIPISDYFYQINGNKTHFVIEFQQSILEEIKLEKLYFRNQTAEIKIISDQKAEAILEFNQKGKIKHHKFTNVTEKSNN